MLLFETGHQVYNHSFIKICNLLYLLLGTSINNEHTNLKINQQNIADILGITRVNVAQNIARLRKEKIIVTYRNNINVINIKALMKYCSQESINL
jgi:DNA-binding MarR family transcriptional regulator